MKFPTFKTKKFFAIGTVTALLLTTSGCDVSDVEKGIDIIDSVTSAASDNTSTTQLAPKGDYADLVKYNDQAKKYSENYVKLDETSLTKDQKVELSENGQSKEWFDYEVNSNGTPSEATALVTYDSVRSHASDVVKRPAFKSNVHVAGEYVDGKYDAARQTWYSPSHARSNNKQVQLQNYRGYLYNKSHLVAWSLGGNMEPENLILGTRSQNVGTNYSKDPGGMSYIETAVRNAIYDHHEAKVFYKVVPVYKSGEVVPRGVYVRAYSVNDNGKTVNESIYTLNTQENIEINYTNGTFTEK